MRIERTLRVLQQLKEEMGGDKKWATYRPKKMKINADVKWVRLYANAIGVGILCPKCRRGILPLIVDYETPMDWGGWEEGMTLVRCESCGFLVEEFELVPKNVAQNLVDYWWAYSEKDIGYMEKHYPEVKRIPLTLHVVADRTSSTEEAASLYKRQIRSWKMSKSDKEWAPVVSPGE